MGNNIDRDNIRLMELTLDNAKFLHYIVGYLEAYAQAGIDLENMFETYGEMEMTEDQQKLYNDIYGSFQEIVVTMRRQYLPK